MINYKMQEMYLYFSMDRNLRVDIMRGLNFLVWEKNMNKKMKKIIAIVIILLGIISIITTSLNLQVTLGNTEAFLAGEVDVPVSSVLTWGLNLMQVLGFFYIVFAEKFKKSNLFWILVLPLGCIVLGTRQLLRLNKLTLIED